MASCTEVLMTKPDLALTKQPEISLAPRIALTVIDDGAGERGNAYAGQLGEAIASAYPQAIESRQSRAEPPVGRVTRVIHIRQQGAVFNRTRSSLLASGGSTLTRVEGTTTGWDGVVAAAATTEPVASGTVYVLLPGNWSGIADLDIEVHDRRLGQTASFTLPLVAERSRPNDLGFVAAMMVADDAWQSIAPRLTAFLDAAVRKIKTEGS